MAPAGFNVLYLLLAIGLAVTVGAVLAVVDIRRANRPAPTPAPEAIETVEHERRAA